MFPVDGEVRREARCLSGDGELRRGREVSRFNPGEVGEPFLFFAVEREEACFSRGEGESKEEIELELAHSRDDFL